jgi:phosphoribosylaminoimidazole (AIR) synthetase
MYRTFNMGVGFVLVCPEREVGAVTRIFKGHGHKTLRLGMVQKRRGVWIRGERIE